MNSVLMYKGYTGRVEIDLNAGILFGRVIDITDVITFQGSTVPEVHQAFYDSVDDYLAYCEERGEEPDRPFSGKLLFRTTPERHHRIFVAATLRGKSVNAWVDEVLVEAAEHTIQTHGSVPTSTDDVSPRWRIAYAGRDYSTEEIGHFLAATPQGRDFLFSWNNLTGILRGHCPDGIDIQRDYEELTQYFARTGFAKVWTPLIEYVKAHSDEIKAPTS